jgi:Mg-chelatase subunit ChlD
MWTSKRSRAIGLLLVTAILVGQRFLAAQASATPLTEEKVVQFLKVGLDDDVIAAQVKKQGIAFPADDAALKRLQTAGASDAVLDVIRAAGTVAARPAPSAKKAVTYDDILGLLQSGVPEAAILKALKTSPTVFVLDAGQVAALRKAGATEALLASMQGGRTDVRSAEISNLAIILDCSLSMKEGTKEGPTKMTVAKRLVAELVRSIPEGLAVTFFIYGHDKRQPCQAVRKVWNLAPLNAEGKQKLTSFIAALQPVGNTPIALALHSAGQELASAQGPSGLVLISDGKETCQGDPSAEAAALSKALNLEFGVNVIGFGVAGDEQKSLEAIAEAGHGKYYDADTAAEFRDVIQAIRARVQAAAKPIEKKAVRAGMRSIRVLVPKDFPLPGLVRLRVVRSDEPISADLDGAKTVAGASAFGAAMFLPSADAYDVIFDLVGSRSMYVVRNLALRQPGQLDVKIEEHLGVVRCRAKGLPQVVRFSLVKAGQPNDENRIQSCLNLGDPIPAPPGTYDLWIAPLGAPSQRIAADIELKAGQIIDIE